jgi:hypothetical protein
MNKSKDCWQGIRIMCPSGVACPPTASCVSELAPQCIPIITDNSITPVVIQIHPYEKITNEYEIKG